MSFDLLAIPSGKMKEIHREINMNWQVKCHMMISNIALHQRRIGRGDELWLGLGWQNIIQATFYISELHIQRFNPSSVKDV